MGLIEFDWGSFENREGVPSYLVACKSKYTKKQFLELTKEKSSLVTGFTDMLFELCDIYTTYISIKLNADDEQILALSDSNTDGAISCWAVDAEDCLEASQGYI